MTIDLSVPPALRPEAIRLVSQRVVASGTAQQTGGGRLRLAEVTGIEPQEGLPGVDAEAFHRPAPLRDLLADAAPLSPLDELAIEGLTGVEAGAFLRAIT